jgi:hypothetical protein
MPWSDGRNSNVDNRLSIVRNSMSWSDGRNSNVDNNLSKGGDGVKISTEHKKKLEAIRQINGVLNSFAQDEDLQDDLKLPLVRLAIDHWSGIRRMPPESYTKQLEKDRRVNSVYPKLKLFQLVCNEAQIKVPLDHMLKGKVELDSNMLILSFGSDFCMLHGLTRPLAPVIAAPTGRVICSFLSFSYFDTS